MDNLNLEWDEELTEICKTLYRGDRSFVPNKSKLLRRADELLAMKHAGKPEIEPDEDAKSYPREFEEIGDAIDYVFYVKDSERFAQECAPRFTKVDRAIGA